MCSPNSLLLREKLGVGGFIPILWHCAESEVYSESVSAFPIQFDVGVFSFSCYVGVIQLLSESLSEGITPYIAVYFVCLWEKGSLEATYVTILVNYGFYFYKAFVPTSQDLNCVNHME